MGITGYTSTHIRRTRTCLVPAGNLVECVESFVYLSSVSLQKVSTYQKSRDCPSVVCDGILVENMARPAFITDGLID